MIRSIIGGAVAAALLSGPLHAAPPKAPARAAALPWVVTPTEAGCRVDLELVGSSGSVTPVTLASDGQVTSLAFFKEDLPARAFLPIRIDRQRFSNLMLRGAGSAGELILSEETEAAIRRGGVLGIAWLADEPLTASLSGSEQGLVDLKVCGAQTAARHRERLAAERSARERADAEARARALSEAQLAAVEAQKAAAEAQRRQVEEAADRQRRAEAQAAERAYQEARQRAYEDERRRAYESARAAEEEDSRWYPPRPAYPYPAPRSYTPPPRYGYERY
ncbi:MAG: hypothetical protein JNK30_09100 [Phenylobacterium sp.]|uniref:hypothetical protein n=1 Tax=Phenylobacterium sp. TaxID=1871053 RepID=UPI001A3FD841|nr:hypothetical protein [Phenylobacterium sp.]MBL8771526.1 hypothetical protein [Phenylobacterium sp.]